MGHDELCLLSAIRPGGGPSCLLPDIDQVEKVSNAMADEIRETLKDSPPNLASILREPLVLATDEESDWKPPGLTQWPYFDTCIAIGYFNEYGSCSDLDYTDDGEPRIPGGRGVEIRRVANDVGRGWFDCVLEMDEEKEIPSNCSTCDGNPNFFVLEGCYKYLEAWLDRDSLPPRCTAFPNDPEPMSLGSEFYEIVNSQAQPRRDDDYPMGPLPCLDYGGMENTCPQYQDDFIDTRTGSKWTSEAIGSGLCGRDLLPSLIRDFGAWMCMRPDIWPTPKSVPQYARFADASTQGHFHRIPLEIFIDIAENIPVSSFVALSMTCHFVRDFLTDTPVLNSVLRAAVLSSTGSLRWLLPVGTIRGEIEQATSVGNEWLASRYALTGLPQSPLQSSDPTSPFLHHAFPFYAFVPACLSLNTTPASMSISSRRRFWKIIQQFESLWMDYRVNGWQRPQIFSGADVEEISNGI